MLTIKCHRPISGPDFEKSLDSLFRPAQPQALKRVRRQTRPAMMGSQHQASQNMEAQPVNKRRLFIELFAFLLFFVIGAFNASHVLTYEGEVAGRYKEILFWLIICRLAWSIYKRNFSFVDYFVYIAISVGFNIWLDSHVRMAV